MKKRINIAIILSAILASGNNLQYVIERQIALVPSNLIDQINLLLREVREEGRVLFHQTAILGDTFPEVYITVVTADAVVFQKAIKVPMENTISGIQATDDAIKRKLGDISSEIRKDICIEILCSPNFKIQRVM